MTAPDLYRELRWRDRASGVLHVEEWSERLLPVAIRTAITVGAEWVQVDPERRPA